MTSSSATSSSSAAVRGATVLFLAAIVAGFDAGAIGFLLPSIRGDIGLDATRASWLVAFYVAGTLIAVPLAGAALRRYGDRTVFRVCAALATVAALAAALAPGAILLVPARLMQGFGQGPLLSIAAAIVAARWPLERQGRMMGALSLAYGVAFLGGMVVTPLLLQWGWRAVFALAAVLAAGVLAAARGDALPQAPLEYARPVMPRHGQLVAIAVVALGTGIGQALVIYFPTLAVERLGITPAGAGWLMLPLVIGGIGTTIAVTGWLDRAGARRMLAWAAAGTLAGGLVAAAAPASTVAFLSGSALLGVGITGLCAGPLRYAAARAAGAAEQGLVQAMVAFVTNVGVLGGSLLLGAVASAGADAVAAAENAVVATCLVMALLYLPVLALRSHDALTAR